MTFDWELLAFMGKVALILIALLVVVVYVAAWGNKPGREMDGY